MEDFEGKTENHVAHGEASLNQPSIWRYIAAFPTWMACFALFALMLMTFIDVTLRSALNNPLEWGTELTRIFMAIIVFASLPIVSWKGSHIVVDLMDPLFSRRMALIRNILIDLISGIALLWPAKRVWDLAERARSFGDVTEYMGFPQYIPGWFIAFFTLATAIVFIVRGITRIVAPHKVPSR